MATLYSGGCACGAVRYETDSHPIFQNHCQCLHCRKRSGTGHSSYLTFADRKAVATSGDITVWRVRGDSGNEKLHGFCPICGTPVFLGFAAMPDLLAVHAGSLDDASLFAPEAVTYAIRALNWDAIADDVPRFDRMAG